MPSPAAEPITAADMPPASALPDDRDPLVPTASDWVGCLSAAFSCWWMAGAFVVAWWRPRLLENGAWVPLGIGVLVLEFILLHSAGMLDAALARHPGRSRYRVLLGLTAFYTLFAVAIALAFRSRWLLGSFLLVMVGRWWSAVRGSGPMEQAVSRRRVVAGALLFLGLGFATVFVPVPRGGLTPALLAEVWPERRNGVWERHPERALAMGAAYFALLGLVECRPPRRRAPPAA